MGVWFVLELDLKAAGRAFHVAFLAVAALLWVNLKHCHSQEPGKDALCVPRARAALSKPCTCGGVSPFSELSKAKIRRKTGNYLVLVEFIFLPAHHSAVFSLSCDIPAAILKRTKLSRQKNLSLSQAALGDLPWHQMWKFCCSGAVQGFHFFPAQHGAPHRLFAFVLTLWHRSVHVPLAAFSHFHPFNYSFWGCCWIKV